MGMGSGPYAGFPQPMGPQTQPPAVGHRRRRGLWIAVVVTVPALLLLTGAGAFALASFKVAAQKHSEAIKVLEASRVHNNEVNAELTATPSFTALGGTNSDTKRFGQQVTAYSTRLKSASATIAGDLPRLRAEDNRLKDSLKGPLATLTRGQYEADRKRIEAMIDALDAAGSGLAIFSDEVAYLDKLVTMLDSLDQVQAKADVNDISGALAQYPKVDSSKQALVAASGGPNVSPQLRVLALAVALLADDYRVALQAIQTNDRLTLRAALQRIDMDVTNAEAFDEPGFEAWEANQLKPYRDRYEHGIKAAGFVLQT